MFRPLMRKQIAIIIISSIFMLALMTSSPVSSVRVAGTTTTTTQNEQNLPYSVSVSPPVLRVQQKDLATFDVKVSRGSSDTESSSVHLSLISDSSLLKSSGSFDPPVLNFRQGQTFANSTLRVNSQEIGVGTTAFGVQAATQSHSPATSDRALSNPATIIVRAAEPGSQSLTTSESLPTEKTTEPTTSKLNYPPIAKADQDQIIKEGERGVLDGSVSTDPDKDALFFSWQQISPKQPIIKLYPSDASSKVSFLAPDVDRDTTFRFSLQVKDTDGAQAVDSINILIKNVKEPESESPLPAAGLPKPEEEGAQTQNQEKPSLQEPAPNTDTTVVSPPPPSNQVPASTENHSPTTVTLQTMVTSDGSPLAITLNGNDPDKDDSLTFVTSSAPSHGTIAAFDKSSGSLTYLPNAGFTGKDSFKYKVIDNNGAESNEASVLINIGKGEEGGRVDKQTTTTTTLATTASSAINISKVIEDRLNQRQEILDAKLKETLGQKIANQYIVVLKSGPAPTDTQSIVDDAKSRGAKVLQQYQKALKGFTINVQNQDELAAILNDSDVAYAEPDVKVKAFTQTIPTGIDRVDADLSSAKSGDGKGDAIDADIAILDTGIDLNHADLNVYKHVTYVPGTTTGNDDNGHGTMVAGIAAARDNDWGGVGVAPGARLWSVKVLDSTGSGSLSSVLQGLDYVTSSANELEVADMSFGCENCSSPTLDAAIHNAVTSGVTIVVAAGNGAKDASTFSPANHPEVIAVSAIADSDGKCGGQGSSTSAGADDTLASFSNFGPAIDMAAPGVQIYSTTKNGGYSIASGTSMAAPHITGAVALYMSKNPNASPSQVLATLKGQGTTSSNDCDGKGHGYFTGNKDSSKEPLLYVGSPSSAAPAPEIPAAQYNNTSTTNTSTNNTTGTTPEPSSSAPPTNTTINTSSNNTNGSTQIPPPVSGNVTGKSNSGNVTGSGNQTSSNQTSSNQTFRAMAGDTWYFLRQFGQGTLDDPHGVALDKSTGRVYVADTGNGRIVVFKSDGTLEGAIPAFGIDDFGPEGPEDLVIAPLGNGPEKGVYVTDPGTNRIYAYSLSGDLLVENNLGYSPGGIGYGGQSGEEQWWVTEPTQDNPKIYYYEVDSPPGTLDLAGQFIPTIPGGFVGRPTDVICCLSPDIAGVEQKVYVADVHTTGPGINLYDSSPPHDNWRQCCQLEDPYGIDVIPGPGAVGRVIFTANGIHGYNAVVSLYPDLGSHASQVDSGTGSPGSGPGEVNRPRGIDVDPSEESPGSGTDTVYVADSGNDRIEVFVNTDPGDTTPSGGGQTSYNFLKKWGSTGANDGQFGTVTDISLDPINNVVYVVDRGNHRIQKFGTDGSFIMKWGSFGTGDGQFSDPRGIARDPSTGAIYVTDSGNYRIQKFDSNGNFISKWGSQGLGDGQFLPPVSVAVDSSGNVYVTDGGGAQTSGVQKFDSNGNFITRWGSYGTGDGQFRGIWGIAVDSAAGAVYVADAESNVRIQKFDTDGNFITKWGMPSTHSSTAPSDVAVDSFGYVYVTELFSAADRIEKFTGDGIYVATIGDFGSNDGQLAAPEGIAVDPSGDNVFVADTGNNRIQVFSTTVSGELSMTLEPDLPKWGHEVRAHITPTGALEDDKITVDWADGTPVSEILSVTDGEEVTATHVYEKPTS
ncbi:MAG TPA: S8 family serine peptidase, partial [Nitrososphaera sp.]